MRVKFRLSIREILDLTPKEIRLFFETQHDIEIEALKQHALVAANSFRVAYHGENRHFTSLLNKIEGLGVKNKDETEDLDEDSMYKHLENQIF